MTTILATAPELMYAAILAGVFMLLCVVGFGYGVWELFCGSLRAVQEHQRIERLLKPLHGKARRMKKPGFEPAINEVLTLGGRRLRCVRDDSASYSCPRCAGRHNSDICLPVRCAADHRKDKTDVLLVEEPTEGSTK